MEYEQGPVPETADAPHQHRLYRSVGCHDVARLDGVALHAFVDIRGAGLRSRPGPSSSS